MVIEWHLIPSNACWFFNRPESNTMEKLKALGQAWGKGWSKLSFWDAKFSWRQKKTKDEGFKRLCIGLKVSLVSCFYSKISYLKQRNISSKYPTISFTFTSGISINFAALVAKQYFKKNSSWTSFYQIHSHRFSSSYIHTCFPNTNTELHDT